MSEDPKIKIVVSNRKASFEYHILQKFEAGIVLTGTEVKSIRAGKINLVDSHARIDHNELWLVNAHISEYKHGNINNHDPIRSRKLLLNRSEIRKITVKINEKGFTIVPLSIYFKDGKVKVELAMAQGKKMYDKRETLAKKDFIRDQERKIKY